MIFLPQSTESFGVYCHSIVAAFEIWTPAWVMTIGDYLRSLTLPLATCMWPLAATVFTGALFATDTPHGDGRP